MNFGKFGFPFVGKFAKPFAKKSAFNPFFKKGKFNPFFKSPFWGI